MENAGGLAHLTSLTAHDGTSPARGACAVPQLAVPAAPCCCFLSLQPADPTPTACSVSQLRTCIGAAPRGQGCSSWAAGRCPRRALSLGTVPQEGTSPTLPLLPPPQCRGGAGGQPGAWSSRIPSPRPGASTWGWISSEHAVHCASQCLTGSRSVVPGAQHARPGGAGDFLPFSGREEI